VFLAAVRDEHDADQGHESHESEPNVVTILGWDCDDAIHQCADDENDAD